MTYLCFYFSISYTSAIRLFHIIKEGLYFQRPIAAENIKHQSVNSQIFANITRDRLLLKKPIMRYIVYIFEMVGHIEKIPMQKRTIWKRFQTFSVIFNTRWHTNALNLSEAFSSMSELEVGLLYINSHSISTHWSNNLGGICLCLFCRILQFCGLGRQGIVHLKVGCMNVKWAVSSFLSISELGVGLLYIYLY